MAKKSTVVDTRKDETQSTLSKEGSFSVALLSDADKKLFEFVELRIPQLQKSRKNHYGTDLDQIYTEADRDYIPHRLGTKTKKVIATDETKGWRSSKVTLGEANWQADLSQSNPYIKIQTALSIMVEQNPSGVFTPTTRKYEATSALIKQLYSRSWDYAKSKAQLILFVFNLAKYGWATARTYPLRITRKVKVMTSYDQENPEKSTYEEKEVVEYNDIFRENLDVRNVWMDDMAKPNNAHSVKDWAFRKIYDMDVATDEFGKYPFWKYVQKGGVLSETINNSNAASNSYSGQVSADKDTSNSVEIYFYENRIKDLFMVIANGVPVCIEPLPISDAKGLKKLSLWQTYWNLRHGESPYGIGIYESIRYDQAFLDRIRNMTIDQLTLSIYKMFFYQGTQSLTDTGDIKIQPGVGRQVLDPKNITWLDVPGPGKDAYLGIDMFRKDVDEASGITDPLLGQITGKTAFETAQAKEAALKRLKNPLNNILEALNDEGYITVALMQLLYSIPETYEISDPYLIEAYLKETGSDPDLYERSSGVDDMGEPKDIFTAKVYPEFPLNLDKDEKGNLIETNDTQFFRTKPGRLSWEGMINIKSQSLLSSSKQVEKALQTEMYNLLIPLLQSIAQERMMKIQANQDPSLDNLTNGKTAKEIIKLYDKDPKDILPDDWFTEQQPKPSLFLNAGTNEPGAAQLPPGPGGVAASQGAPQPGQQQAPQAQTMVPSTTPPQNPTSLLGRIGAAATNMFKR